MEDALKLLLERGVISRKQMRELARERFASLPELRQRLLNAGWIDAPDWKELESALPDGEDLAADGAPPSRSALLREVESTALRVAKTETTVLLLGESGVGKSRLAELIHRASARRKGPLVTVACGSFPETLLESELFGVEKGAYTGATKSREGRFARARGGTVFLDEIGELTPPLQVKLLRVLQERRVEPLGSSEELEVDIRLIAATNRNLEADVRAGRFREDLFFRLNVVPLTLPALRERKEDVLPLAQYFLERQSEKHNRIFTLDDPRALAALEGYSWPGNIRELENCIERLVVLSDAGRIRYEDLPPRILRETGRLPAPARPRERPAAPDATDAGERLPTLREAELQLITTALERHRGNVNRAALALGVHRNTLARKIEEFGLDRRAFRRARRDSAALKSS